MATTDDDPYLWLEEIEGAAALGWVRERNAETAAGLGSSDRLATIEDEILAVLDSQDKIPGVTKIGDRYYNFWRDAAHERGIWRRTTLDSFRSPDPEWETVLDLDALAEREGVAWVWHGASALRPTDPGTPFRRAIVDLSRGGSDADISRELDLQTLEFVERADGDPAGGFWRDEAKGGLAWIDEATVYVFTDFGEDASGEPTTTTSGYPRVVKRWRRGTPLASAETVYEGRADDLYISAHRTRDRGLERDVVERAVAFYESETFWRTPAGELRLIEVPRSASVGVRREWLLIELRDDWTVGGATYAAGALLATRFEDFMAGSRTFTVLFEPTATTSLAGAAWTLNHLVVNVLDDVKNRLHVLTPPAPDPTDGTGAPVPSGIAWTRSELTGIPVLGTIGVTGVDPHTSDDVWLTATDYLTPTTLSICHVPGPDAPDSDAQAPEHLKAQPSFFAATGLVASQHFATSDDGTRVPYFQVGPADSVDGAPGASPAPTLLYGYGGFEISLTPGYSGGLGRAWLARGGTYVVANIRGGGEYGPAWHQAALKENRHRAYEDFAAVARDLVARGVTTAERLGAQGGSNGGLLMGNMLVTYPALFGAIVVQVPLLDMRRYSHLLAGASWIAEYGDPDDADQWTYIRTFSPYQLVEPDREYPAVLFTTSTRDDRVHPAHARKMAAKMSATGNDVTYFENIEGGHGGAATNRQAAHMAALAYEFLWQRVGAVTWTGERPPG